MLVLGSVGLYFSWTQMLFEVGKDELERTEQVEMSKDLFFLL